MYMSCDFLATQSIDAIYSLSRHSRVTWSLRRVGAALLKGNLAAAANFGRIQSSAFSHKCHVGIPWASRRTTLVNFRQSASTSYSQYPVLKLPRPASAPPLSNFNALQTHGANTVETDTHGFYCDDMPMNYTRRVEWTVISRGVGSSLTYRIT